MSRLAFNLTFRTEAVVTVAFGRPDGQMVLAGGARKASPALVRSRI